MNKQIKTRVYRDGREVEFTIKGTHRFLVVFDTYGRTLPFVWTWPKSKRGDDIYGLEKRIPRTDKRYAAALRIALSAIYRVDLTV